MGTGKPSELSSEQRAERRLHRRKAKEQARPRFASRIEASRQNEKATVGIIRLSHTERMVMKAFRRPVPTVVRYEDRRGNLLDGVLETPVDSIHTPKWARYRDASGKPDLSHLQPDPEPCPVYLRWVEAGCPVRPVRSDAEYAARDEARYQERTALGVG